MADRPNASRPPGSPSVFMRWASLLFMHWPCDPEMLKSLIPESLKLDTFEGQAWVGLVPFTMKIRHRFVPVIPTARDFLECNVRTYVVREGDPGAGVPGAGRPGAGVWFFSLDAQSKLAVIAARKAWQLNYVHSRMSLESREDGTIHYEVKRVRRPEVGMKCVWKPGDFVQGRQDLPSLSGAERGRGKVEQEDSGGLPIAQGSPIASPSPQPSLSRAREKNLAHFLTERYALYSCDLKTKRYVGRGRIWHEPWPLRQAEVLELDENLIKAAGIELDTTNPPLAWHVDAIDVE
ncbi:MAG: DUF2071 domain-containing protein, partial [Planctomycetota bacterium]|nr:DUF2071 domain-containing protein [Planctomycetota bacterium]